MFLSILLHYSGVQSATYLSRAYLEVIEEGGLQRPPSSRCSLAITLHAGSFVVKPTHLHHHK